MIEKLHGLDKISILQCQKMAQDVGYDSATFDLVGPKATLKCTWLDAYMGMFRADGHGDGFFIVSQFQYVPDLYCQNLMPATSEETK